MIDDMELRRRTWSAALKLAVVASLVAATIAVVVSSIGDVPQAAIVLPVILTAFTASWIQTGRIRREAVELPVLPRRPMPHSRAA